MRDALAGVLAACVAALAACSPSSTSPLFPLELVKDVELPGKPVRFDYQDVDVARQRLVIAHMNDASVVVVSLADGSTLKVVPNVPTARGVAIADSVGKIFVTSSPDQVVVLDAASLDEVARVTTGASPDGVAWDAKDAIVGVSAQGAGALTLLTQAGAGARTDVPLGDETGNVVFDEPRGVFWVTVVKSGEVDALVAVDPITTEKKALIDLPGCDGAHGLRLHPDGATALVACEANDKLVRVDLVGDTHAVVTADTGGGPDVMAIDAALGLLYVAAESGDLGVFDIAHDGLLRVDAEHVDDAAHSVAVDGATHRVFFPLVEGANGKPVLRIMKPRGM